MNEQAWLEKKDWQKNEIFSDAKFTLIFLWVFAVFWNAMMVPLGLQFPEMLVKAKQDPWIYIFFSFPLIGLYLLVQAIKTLLEWRSLGRTPLVMDPFPGSIGGHVGGKITTNLKHNPAIQAAVTLSCMHSRMTGSGKNRRRRESAVWQNSGRTHQGQSERGTYFQFRFDVPDNLSPSEVNPASSSYYLWRLTLEIKISKRKTIVRSFEIPVFATATESAHLRDGTEDHEGTKEAAQIGLESVAIIRSVSNGLEIFYPAFKRPGMSSLMMFVGAVFSVIGYFIVAAGLSKVFLAFIVVGVLFLLLGVYDLFKSLRVLATSEGIQVRRSVFGVTLFTRRIARDQLRGFEIVKTGSSQYNGKTLVDYKLVALTADGEKHTVAERHQGRPEIELIQSKLQSVHDWY